jgi:hypothetical protein
MFVMMMMVIVGMALGPMVLGKMIIVGKYTGEW